MSNYAVGMKRFRLRSKPGATSDHRIDTTSRSRRLSVSLALALASIVLSSCRSSAVDTTVGAPQWAETAVWYQIFVERFRNGDPTNDPRPHDIDFADPGPAPPGWATTEWTQDWYRQEDWAVNTGRNVYSTVQSRRYGGDLQGVLERVDYIQALGVNAIYFNPLNDAPSLHKYDARNYRHIDRNFGPDPRRDEQTMAEETPSDPSTWQWTSADSLFLELVDELHSRGIRVILDYSWNHTGVAFWAWRDLVENQTGSDYADWYEVDRFDDPGTLENEFAYTGWAGVSSLPNFRKVGVPADYRGGPVEGNLNPGAKALVFAVTRRWLDPDGDGDPSDGIDGFRLDVAEQVPLGFWRDYRAFVKSINPDAYLVGEIWWEEWPDRMMDPRPYLGDVFDAVMNYRWYKAARSLVSGAPPDLSPTEFVTHMDSLEAGIADRRLRAMMNVAATHDSPRLATSLYNPGRYKYRVNPREDPGYRIGRPDARARKLQRLLLIQQFTYYGGPHIWYGDEVGMWGADDPDTRKPMLWSDLDYRPETTSPDGSLRPPEPVAPDTVLLDFYRSLTRMRAQYADQLANGGLRYTLADDARGLLGYERTKGDTTLLVFLNVSEEQTKVQLPEGQTYWLVLGSEEGLREISAGEVGLPGLSGVVLARQ